MKSADLFECCGSQTWVSGMLQQAPFTSLASLQSASKLVWKTLQEADLLEAVSHHPQIGGKTNSNWSSQEQKSMQDAGSTVKHELVEWNRKYYEKFGYVFIICATGKSADQMLATLKHRYTNEPNTEIAQVSEQLFLITQLRLQKLYERELSK